MCTTRVLAKSRSGFISQCLQCKSIHVAFGTALLSMNTSEYNDFSNQVFQDSSSLLKEIQDHRKCVQIPHPNSAEFSVVLTQKELSQMVALIQEANLLHSCFSVLEDE